MRDLTGDWLGQYRLIRRLGEGGFGVVYLGEDSTHRLVAIKVLDPSKVGEEGQRSFLATAKILASLQHPHIVQIMAVALENGVPYLVMEYAPGGDLQKHKDQVLEYATIASYVQQIADAVQYIHDNSQLVHCDIKPANVLIRANGELILSDFDVSVVTRSVTLSQLQQIAGTVQYMAPELLALHPVRASDQYSLGIMTYEWLSGKLPFEGSKEVVLHKQQFEDPPPLYRKDTDERIPPLIENVVLRALAKEPRDRFPTVKQFAEALKSALQEVIRGQWTIPSVGASSTRDLSSSSRPIRLPPPQIQQYRALIERLQEAIHLYQRNKHGCEQERDRAVATLYQKKQTRQAAIERTREWTLHRTNDLHTGLHSSGWENWLELGTTFLVNTRILRTSAPFQLAAPTSSRSSRLNPRGWRAAPDEQGLEQDAFLNAYTERMRAYKDALGKQGHRIDAFLLKRYQQPAKFVQSNTAVAAIFLLLFTLFQLLRSGWNTSASLILFGLTLAIVLLSVLLLAQLFWFCRAYLRIQQTERQVQSTYERQLEELEQRTEQERSQLLRDCENRLAEMKREGESSVGAIQHDVMQFLHQLGYAATDWAQRERWEHWIPPQQAQSPVARIGTFHLAASADLPFALPPLPALVACPYGSTIVFEVAGAEAREQAVAAIQALTLRILATQSPGQVLCTFIDPHALGENVAPFFSLPDPYDLCGIKTAWYEEQDIRRQLQQLRSCIAQRRKSGGAGATEHPSHLLVVMDFPRQFPPDAVDMLLGIAHNGPARGISTLIIMDTDRQYHYFSPTQRRELEQDAVVLVWSGHHFVWQNADIPASSLQLDTPPHADAHSSQDLFNQVLQEIGRAIQRSVSVEQNKELNEVLSQRHWPPFTEKSTLWLGYSISQRRPAAIPLAHTSNSNLLILGRQREIAEDLLALAMVAVAAQHAPTEAQFYAVDVYAPVDEGGFDRIKSYLPDYFRTGGRYREIVKRSDLGTGLTRLLTEMSDELADRASGEAITSSLYLFINGLQLAGHVLRQASLGEKLAALIRDGPRWGIHTLLWCDQPATLTNILDRNALDFFDHRIEVDQKQTLLFSSDQQSNGELLLPYRVPSPQWLGLALTRIQKKSRL